MIIYNKLVFKKFIYNNEIRDKILGLSNKINNYYKFEDVVIICVLNGSVVVL